MAGNHGATLARSDADVDPARLRWHTFLGSSRLSSRVYVIPLAIAASYLVVLIVRLPQILPSLTWSSDVASAFTIPQTLVHTGTGGHTVLSSTGAYVPLWFGLLTASLPLHRELWEIAATTVFLVAALALGGSVSRVASRRAAILAVLLALVVSPAALYIFLAAAAHNTVYLGTALLGAYIVWMTLAHPQRQKMAVAVPILAGVVLGGCLASDLLILVTAIVPFAFTALLRGLQPDRRSRMRAISDLTTVVLAFPIALVTSTIMGSLGFVVVRPPTTTSPLSALPLHAEYLFDGLKELFGGHPEGLGASGEPRAALEIASDVVMTAALLTLLVFGAYTVARLIRSRWRRRGEELAPRDLASALHVVYWAGSAASVIVTFVFSTKAEDFRPQYYATLIFSVAAILPLLMHRASLGRWLVPAGAVIFFTTSLVGLTGTSFDPGKFSRDESTIVRLAEASRATTGYAGYWEASSLTWNSHERVKVRPVSLCENPAGADICPFYISRVPAWYTPTQRRTFLLVNPEESYLHQVPPGLGPPIATYGVGNSTVMYVYPYDIASRLGPARD